jgi:acyl-CoA thioesterase
MREGTGYCQRQVDVWQHEKDGVCFTCICSFKKPEPNVSARQHQTNLREKYREVLGGKSPDDFPECPTVDSPFFWEIEKKYGKDPFPGLRMTKVEMAAYNEARSALDRRQLHFYKILGDIPSVQEDPNLHAAAHLYASDRNGLFPIPNHLGVGDDYSAIASLSHTVIFHVEGDELNTLNQYGKPIWFCQELEVDRIAHGRALVTSKVWRDDGLHVFTHFQDGQLRMKPNDSKRKKAGDIFNGNAPRPAKGKL